ncbi:hypothetical protein SISSUDRAFT_956986, partial [Sistotremastrum suecicum HHB10207 ss-3]
QDFTGLRDYALLKGGGLYISEWTSPTHTFLDPSSSTWLHRLPRSVTYRWIQHAGHGPEEALSSSLEPGSCWPMSGSTGHIGIMLADRIEIQNITVDHLPRTIAPHISQAPRAISVWGYVHENHSTLASLRTRVEFEYDIHASVHIQTFSVDSMVRSLGIAYDVIVLEIKTNWGSADQTCLYRVRVHG